MLSSMSAGNCFFSLWQYKGQKFIMSFLEIHAREIFDSLGNASVEVDLCLSHGLF